MTASDDEPQPLSVSSTGSDAVALVAVAAPRPVDEAEPGELPGFTAIGPARNDRKAREWALVLQSMGIAHAAHATVAGHVVVVRNEDYPRASAAIDRYEQENRDWPPPRTRDRPAHPVSFAIPFAFLALVVFFAFTGPSAGGSSWFQHGTSVADLVVRHEPWRAVTALTLHADGSHVLGNAISGSVFGSAVSRRLGPGGAALAILGSGIVGNLLNALAHHGAGHGHASIGASTAVFGAIGLLAAIQLVIDRRQVRAPKRAWLDVMRPVVGGLALLGALGASPRADLGAHFFGFGAGLVLGLLALGPKRLLARARAADEPPSSVRFEPPKPRPVLQALTGVTAVGVIVGSWALALAA